MNRFGINVELKNVPVLDRDFMPIMRFNRAFLADAKKPVSIAVERADGQMATCHTFIHGTEEMREADHYYIERIVKTILWMKGGFKVYVAGDEDIYNYLKSVYCAGGQQEFDWDYMANVFEHPFEVVLVDAVPEAKDAPQRVGGHLDGCRIGFDAGGSDRKVSAVIDGECVYSEEVVWYPKLNEDPTYQFNGIVEALKTAASKMPRVDAIGVSSAGTFIGNAPMISSIFYKVPRSRWDEVKTVFDRAAAEIGDVPCVVANDGDVSALAGAMGLNKGNIMGLAMGTSEAVGYVDKDKNVKGWISELAFAPVDLSPDAMQDEWSTDFGVGCKYFSQDAVIKLAPRAGIELDPELAPAQKLKVVQGLMEADDERAQKIFHDIGVYLAYAVVQYSHFYDIEHLMCMGRVLSGKGGDMILEISNKVLADEFPELAKKCEIIAPDENTRRVGQAVAAASLPELR